MRSFSTHRDDQSPLGTSPYQGGPPVLYRDALDAKRVADGLSPSSSYPDGYLGTVNTRREDRLGAPYRQDGRAYRRGAHMEKLNPQSYLWPQEFNLATGLEQQASGMRFVSPAMSEEVVMLRNDGRPGPRDPLIGRVDATPAPIDPDRAAQLSRLAPSWGY